MKPVILGTICVAAVTFACVSLTPARADVVYESATYTGADPGDYVVHSGRLIGARFSVAATTTVASIGAGFGADASGTIFGAIVPLASATAFPSVAPADLASVSLGDAVFAVPSGVNDMTEKLSATLAPGEYALVFGSGLFGASGSAGLSDGNATVGSPSFFQSLFSPAWQYQSADGIRVVVSDAAVPEPGTLGVLGAGLVLCAAVSRRRTARG